MKRVDHIGIMLDSYFDYLKSLGYRLKTSRLSYTRYISLRGRQVTEALAA